MTSIDSLYGMLPSERYLLVKRVKLFPNSQKESFEKFNFNIQQLHNSTTIADFYFVVSLLQYYPFMMEYLPSFEIFFDNLNQKLQSF
jgi:hypothetical protein